MIEQRDERDRDQVGDEADQRHLLEEHQRQRRQADRRDDLRAQAAAQRVATPQPHARAPWPRRGRRACSPAPADDISSPTAMNDSQKPGCSSAHGSTHVTATAAASSTSGQGQWRPSVCSSVTVSSISTVRWAGTPQPANTA